MSDAIRHTELTKRRRDVDRNEHFYSQGKKFTPVWYLHVNIFCNCVGKITVWLLMPGLHPVCAQYKYIFKKNHKKTIQEFLISNKVSNTQECKHCMCCLNKKHSPHFYSLWLCEAEAWSVSLNVKPLWVTALSPSVFLIIPGDFMSSTNSSQKPSCTCLNSPGEEEIQSPAGAASSSCATIRSFLKTSSHTLSHTHCKQNIEDKALGRV